MTVSNEPGTLYVVATPIGNLEDISARALRILAQVDLIAAEDTRHTRKLLSHFGINRPLLSLHEHNEQTRAGVLCGRLLGGESIALVSDAGTPLISDPGFPLVRAVRAAGVRVSPVPGACALVAALSVSGLATDRFAFEGFAPAKAAARREQLRALAQEPRTLVFYESGRRLIGMLGDCVDSFGPQRQASVARELSKRFETVVSADLAGLLDWAQASADNQRGEFVVMIAGNPSPRAAADIPVLDSLRLLCPEVGAKRASALVARLFGLPRSEVYRMAVSLNPNGRGATVLGLLIVDRKGIHEPRS